MWMRRTTNKLLLLVISISMLGAVLTSFGALSNAQASWEDDLGTYITHSTIRVNNNAELAAAATSGSGTIGDPYVIEGYDIAGSDGIAIFIGNTTSNLIIRDCYLHGAKYAGDYGVGAGIELYNVRNLVVSNNTCYENNHGVYLYGSSSNTITKNSCIGNGFGVYPYASNNNIISNNTLSGNNYGVYIFSDSNGSSSNNRIFGNIFTENHGSTSFYDPSHVQSFDNGVNLWNSSYGNYWSDWTAPDEDLDGTVDPPYLIDGGTQRDELPVARTLNITVQSPYYTNATTALMSGTASDGFGIESIAWTNEATGASGTAVGTLSWTANIALVEGENNVTVTVTDKKGFTVSDNVTVAYSGGPVVTITPSSPIYTNETHIQLTVNVTNIVPITEVRMEHYVDENLVEDSSYHEQNGNRSFSETKALVLQQGVNLFRFVVSDAAGNYVVSERTVYCDLNEPIVTIESPVDGSCINAKDFTIEWSIEESVSGIAYYDLRVDGGEPTHISANEHGYSITGLSDGWHGVVITAVNNVGVQGSHFLMFVIDTMAPSTTVSPFGNDVPLISQITVRFSETMNTTSVQITINDEDGTISWNGDIATFVPPHELEFNSEYIIMVVGEDLASNRVSMSWRFSTVEAGSIEGGLNDENGNAITNVTVTLSNGQTTTTGDDGRFVFENVSVGSYLITFVKDGYETVTVDVSVNANETSDLTTMITESMKSATPSDNTPLIVVTALGVIAILGISFVVYRRRQ
jgi:parallel beta-helix repeat protein